MERSRELSMDQTFLQNLTDAVFANLNNDQFGAEELAKAVGISRSQVHRKLHKINGKSVTKFIREIRLEQAHQLLEKEVGTASEVAYRVGFSSPTYFTKCFHEHYGYTPGETKNRNTASFHEPSYDEDNTIIPIQGRQTSEPVKWDQKTRHEDYRRLAAIMFTDIVGYTALMGSDEDRAFEVLAKNREIHSTHIAQFNGTLIKEMGDGMLITFDLASAAVRCAIEIQKTCKEQHIPLKIGIHEGEMVFEGNDVLGDGVNIASRLQENAPEGCIIISESVYRDIKNKSTIKTEFLEEKRFKNVDEPIKVYKVHCEKDDPIVNNPKQSTKINLVPYFVLAGLSIVIAVILLWQFLPSTDQDSAQKDAILDKSIAVLPFRNDSPNKENEHLCNGIMEEILNQLQRIKDLRVIPIYTGEFYGNSEKDFVSIASEQEVAFVLTGSVRKVGDSIRVYARIINGGTGDQEWADRYDDAFSNKYLDFQTAIPKQIAVSLKAVITPEEEKRLDYKSTSEIIAYDLYWRGMDKINEYDYTKDLTYIGRANELFDKALNIDPGYSKAIYGKGHAHLMVALETNGSYDSAMIYADRLIQMYPDEEWGYFLMGGCQQLLGQSDAAIANLLKVIEINPNTNWSYLLLGKLYCEYKNDYVAGIPYINKALQLEGPGTDNLLNKVGIIFLNIGDYDKAIEYIGKSIELHTWCWDNLYPYFHCMTLQGKLQELQYFTDSICSVIDCETACLKYRYIIKYLNREYDQAETYYNQFVNAGGSTNVWDSVNIAFIYKKLGKENEAKATIEKVKSSYENLLNNNSESYIFGILSSVHALLDEKDEALKYLSKIAERGFRWGFQDMLEIDPVYEKLCDNPEFKTIVKRAQDEKAAIRAQIREMEERGKLDL